MGKGSGEANNRESIVSDQTTDATPPGLMPVGNPYDVPIYLMSNGYIEVEKKAQRQVEDFVSVAHEVLDTVIITPDIHPGVEIPIGLVADFDDHIMPSVIGGDIGCGMQLLTTDVSMEELASHRETLQTAARHIFFEGGRNLQLTKQMREGILRYGLHGLLDAGEATGLWNPDTATRVSAELSHLEMEGSLPTTDLFSGFHNFLEQSQQYDAHLGSLGGGNHFAEFGSVAGVQDGRAAYGWGMKNETVTIMLHTGSLSIGRSVAGHYQSTMQTPYMKADSELGQQYLQSMNQAANFAFANRLFIGLQMQAVLETALGRSIEVHTVTDAPHNFIWQPDETTPYYRHRKGASPAAGPDGENEWFYGGHPVIIPASMGRNSRVLTGTGNDDTLQSTSHGAGRAIARGKTANLSREQIDQVTLVTPIDVQTMRNNGRADMVEEYYRRTLEESPQAYKDITPVVDSVVASHSALPVSTIKPFMTIKA